MCKLQFSSRRAPLDASRFETRRLVPFVRSLMSFCENLEFPVRVHKPSCGERSRHHWTNASGAPNPCWKARPVPAPRLWNSGRNGHSADSNHWTQSLQPLSQRQGIGQESFSILPVGSPDESPISVSFFVKTSSQLPSECGPLLVGFCLPIRLPLCCRAEGTRARHGPAITGHQTKPPSSPMFLHWPAADPCRFA